MAIIGRGDLAVELVPIELIETGQYVVTTDASGNAFVFQVHAKRWRVVPGAGEATVQLQGEPTTATSTVPECSAQFGALIKRVVGRQPIAGEAQHEPDCDEPSIARQGTDLEPSFRHPKCYANTRGGCSTKISGEHFISHSLIKLYGFDDPTLMIKHDTGYGVRNFVKPSKFVANILCESHNNALHVADDAALAFAKFMRDIALKYRNGAGEWGEYEEITISGDHFQSWLLKLILNHAVGKAFVHQKGEFVSPFPPEAVDVLLGRAMWPRTWGMCVAGDVDNEDLKISGFDRLEDITYEWCSFQPFIHNDGWVGGGIINLNGVGFGITVFDPSRDDPDSFNNDSNPLRGSVQRPGYMAWEIDGVQKRVNFTWRDIWEHKTITYRLSSD
jgi:hypothetical protein